MNAAAKAALLALAVFFSGVFAVHAAAPAKDASVLPLGTWHYGVFMGKTRMGTAHVGLEFDGREYLSTSNMTMQRGNGEVVCVMSESERETASFAPLSYSSSTIIISGSKESRALLKISFSGNDVTIDDGQEKRTVKVEGAFRITPNELSSKMTKEGLKPGSVHKAFIYDPSVDEDKPVEMTETVIGPETVELPTGKAVLTHTVQSFGPLKNIHNYIDARGFTVRTTMIILNQTIDLVLEAYDLPKGKK